MDVEKKDKRFSVATTTDITERLAVAAEKAELPQSILAEAAIKAAVRALEENGYRIVWPPQFRVAYVPIPAEDEQRILRVHHAEDSQSQSTASAGAKQNRRKAGKPAVRGS